jgi:hypothetical protein
MGRYYSGDIEGKLWFGVQSSDDAEFFGSEAEPLYVEGDDEEFDDDDDEKEPYAFYFNFSSDCLEDINDGIGVCLDELGEFKDKFDLYFNENETYNDEKLSLATGCTIENVKKLLEYYARLELGMKIKNCVVETGQCCFEAEL